MVEGEAQREGGLHRADTVAQLRGSEDQAQGPTTDGKRMLESIIVEVDNRTVPDWMCCESQDTVRVSDLGNEIDAAALTSGNLQNLCTIFIFCISLSDSHVMKQGFCGEMQRREQPSEIFTQWLRLSPSLHSVGSLTLLVWSPEKS